jgi:hypothetical protein
LVKDPEWVYLKTVCAHRSYLLALTMYKNLRYCKSSSHSFPYGWYDIDQKFISVIEGYNQKELRVLVD